MSRGVVSMVIATLMVAGAAGRALAQGGDVGEIVVTAEKRSLAMGGAPVGVSAYNGGQVPHVTLVKRADNLITQVRVVCDTRDAGKRREELKATLRNMIRGSNAQIELGVGDDVIQRFDDTMLDKVIAPEPRAVDTSVAVVVVKTHILAGDTFDSATARITGFIDRTEKAGRTEILREQDWSLTIINPEQYRTAIVEKVAADAKVVAGAFGPGYGVSVESLQNTVDWRQSGALDLSLFIPYRLIVEPLGR